MCDIKTSIYHSHLKQKRDFGEILQHWCFKVRYWDGDKFDAQSLSSFHVVRSFAIVKIDKRLHTPFCQKAHVFFHQGNLNQPRLLLHKPWKLLWLWHGAERCSRLIWMGWTLPFACISLVHASETEVKPRGVITVVISPVCTWFSLIQFELCLYTRP